jgi:MFS family permease
MLSSIACIFAPDIGSLIAFRTMEAVGVSSLFIVGAGVIADTFPPAERGYAMGIFGIPPLVGPIIGPVVGGAIATAFSWRATFVFLAIVSFLLWILLILLVPETLPFLVFTRTIQKRLPDTANPFPKPHFMPPWMPFVFYKIPTIVTLTIASGLGFCCLCILKDSTTTC